MHIVCINAPLRPSHSGASSSGVGWGGGEGAECEADFAEWAAAVAPPELFPEVGPSKGGRHGGATGGGRNVRILGGKGGRAVPDRVFVLGPGQVTKP
jgi:hypothetical protein